MTRSTYPQIYVFEDKHEPDWLKVGGTTRKNAEDRVRQQTKGLSDRLNKWIEKNL